MVGNMQIALSIKPFNTNDTVLDIFELNQKLSEGYKIVVTESTSSCLLVILEKLEKEDQ